MDKYFIAYASGALTTLIGTIIGDAIQRKKIKKLDEQIAKERQEIDRRITEVERKCYCTNMKI